MTLKSLGSSPRWTLIFKITGVFSSFILNIIDHLGLRWFSPNFFRSFRQLTPFLTLQFQLFDLHLNFVRKVDFVRKVEFLLLTSHFLKCKVI